MTVTPHRSPSRPAALRRAALRVLALASAGVLSAVLAGCTADAAAPEPATTSASATLSEGPCAEADTGVTLTVDASALADGDTREWCRLTDEPLAVSDLLDEAGVVLTGTEQYPDFICRVDGLPSADAPLGSTEDPDYVETCETTPAAFGYWALWVQPEGGDWAYAEEGAATLTAQPGEGIALLFTLDGSPAAPTA